MLRLGFIGAGYYIEHRILPAIAQSSTVEATYLQRRDTERLAAMATKFDIANTTTLREELLASNEVDVVWVASPNTSHFDDAMAVIAAGKHVIVEKPCTTSVETTQQLVEAAEAAGVKLGVGYNARLSPSIQYLKEHLPRLGTIRRIEAHLAVQRQNVPKIGHTYPAWCRGENQAGVGTLYDLGSHIFDLLFFIGGPGWNVDACRGTTFEVERADGQGTISILDSATVQFSGPNDASAQLYVSDRGKRSSGLSVIGSEGLMTVANPLARDIVQSVSFSNGAQQSTIYFAEYDILGDFVDEIAVMCGGEVSSVASGRESIAIDSALEAANQAVTIG